MRGFLDKSGGIEAAIELLSRGERNMLRKAYAASERRPLQVLNGPKGLMQKVAERMIDKGLCRLVPGQFFAVVLTPEGFQIACELRRQGWPDARRDAGEPRA